MSQTFPKKERLHSKKLIDQLFENGQQFFVFPFKVFHLQINNMEDSSAQLLITIPKRNHKNATDRNKLKRLIREAYRLNKSSLYNQLHSTENQLLIGMIYVGREMLSFAEIERKIILILQRLTEQDEQAAG